MPERGAAGHPLASGGAAARALAAGDAEGRTLVLSAPLSFWGGLDRESGRIIDRHHPQAGVDVTGRVLVMPSGRGSSSSSSVLAEAIRAGTGPAAIVLREPDPIVALGAIVAAELYGIEVPVVCLPAERYDAVAADVPVRVRALPDGTAAVEPA